MQRKFICRLNTQTGISKPIRPKGNLLEFTTAGPEPLEILGACCETLHISLLLSETGLEAPNHVTRCSFRYCLSLPKRKGCLRKGCPRKGCYSFVSQRGLNRLYSLSPAAQCRVYALQSCRLHTYAWKEVFAGGKEKRRKNIHVNSNVQMPASSASRHTSFVYLRMQNKSCSRHKPDSLQRKGSKHIHRADALSSGAEQGGGLLLSCSAVLGLFWHSRRAP